MTTTPEQMQMIDNIMSVAMKRIKETRKRHNPNNAKMKQKQIDALNEEIAEIKADASFCLIRWL